MTKLIYEECRNVERAGVVVFYKGKILTVLGKVSNKWGLPKGELKDNESLLDALQLRFVCKGIIKAIAILFVLLKLFHHSPCCVSCIHSTRVRQRFPYPRDVALHSPYFFLWNAS